MSKLKLTKIATPLKEYPFAYKLKNMVALYVCSSFIIFAKGYSLYKYDIKLRSLEKWCKIPDKKNAILSKTILLRRLFRAEVRNIYPLKDGSWIFICRKALYRFNPKNKELTLSFKVENGSRPMHICVCRNGNMYFGDYFYNPENNPMNIYESVDNGLSWHVCHTFKKGMINHIHGVFEDEYTNRLWVATGDLDKECIFGYTEDYFKTYKIEFKGDQNCRICYPLFFKDKIIYATDSQYSQNFIRIIDRVSGEIKNIKAIQGSGIYAIQTKDFSMVSTTVEPSEINTDNFSHLWIKNKDAEWKEIAKYKKDRLKCTYFQFGSIRFPEYSNEKDLPITFFGRAVEGLDQSTIILSKVKI